MPFLRVQVHTLNDSGAGSRDESAGVPRLSAVACRQAKRRSIMKNANSTLRRMGLVVALAGFVCLDLRAAGLVDCQNTPMVKNLMAYTAHCSGVAHPHELIRREAKRLAANAKSADDHLLVAHY